MTMPGAVPSHFAYLCHISSDLLFILFDMVICSPGGDVSDVDMWVSVSLFITCLFYLHLFSWIMLLILLFPCRVSDSSIRVGPM